ncbi:MAG: hypothetical protein BGO70_10455 [Bacteroidetes bacterium 43-93]|nr:outer membrane beta-barrel protein [Bacteroidota bacterium]OJW95539.1 MAG: hypothetical protein BGO70_10455 [Bacteroidetes bacterium 43-93]
MMKGYVTFLFFALIFPSGLFAQVQLNSYLGAGASYVTAKNLNTSFMPVIRPNASLITTFPITSRIAIQLGMGYTAKGYHTNQTQDLGYTKSVFLTTTNLHLLSLPLLISYKITDRNDRQFWLDGGMCYNLFLAGTTAYDFSVFDNGQQTRHDRYTYRVIGRFTPSKYGQTPNSYDVNGLDVTLRIQARYVWKRYTFLAYYEHGMYDMRATIGDDATTSLKSRYAGIAIGYRLF